MEPNPFDEAIKRLKNNPKPERPRKQKDKNVNFIDQGDASDTIICDGNNIHTSDGIPLIDPQVVRGIKDEVNHMEEY